MNVYSIVFKFIFFQILKFFASRGIIEILRKNLLQKFRKSFLYSACSANSAMRMNLNILRTNFFYLCSFEVRFYSSNRKNDFKTQYR